MHIKRGNFREAHLKSQFQNIILSTTGIKWDYEMNPCCINAFHHLCRLNHRDIHSFNKWEVVKFLKDLWEKCPMQFPPEMGREEKERIMDYLELLFCWQLNENYDIRRAYAFRDILAKHIIEIVKLVIFLGSAVAVGWLMFVWVYGNQPPR